jgi:hypothetical protein
VLVLCAGIIFIFNWFNLPLTLRAKPGYELQNSTVVQNRSDSGLNLFAFRLQTNQIKAGELIDLTLFWQAQRFLSENYEVRLHLVNNQDGSTWNFTDWHEPGHYPTRRWKSGLYIRDEYHFQVNPLIKSGNYQINIEANVCKPSCDLNNLLTFFNLNGQVIGKQVTLPTLLTVSG